MPRGGLYTGKCFFRFSLPQMVQYQKPRLVMRRFVGTSVPLFHPPVARTYLRGREFA